MTKHVQRVTIEIQKRFDENFSSQSAYSNIG